MIVASACLAGEKCRYDGTCKTNAEVVELVKTGKAITVCPEILGGLSTPRIPAEKIGDRIVRKDGKDITDQFNKGANIALQIAIKHGCTSAILKSKSPMCGHGEIYDGHFSGKTIANNGVFATLLKENNFIIKLVN